MTTENPDGGTLGGGPGRLAALLDVVIYIAAALSLFGIEQALDGAGWLPYASISKGAFSLVGSFFVVVGLMKWRGQGWGALGLRRPRRWWTIPAWGFVVIIVNVAAQITIVPLIAKLFDVPPVDLSRYDIIRGNLKMFLIAAPGTMITGGFIEECIYRGFMIDRFGRLLGSELPDGRRAQLGAALLCGVPFGLVHFQWGIGGMVGTTVMGSVLGLMYLATKRNLWPLIAGHAALDFILMLQVYLGMTAQ